jgi:hypothetical protein
MRLQNFKSTVRRGIQMVKIVRAAAGVRRADAATKHVAQQALAHLLADARGMPMKVGQYLATLPGNTAFAPLTESIDPVPVAAAAATLETALGCPLDQVLSSFEPSQAAASLGQVHRATLKDGQQVAVKIRYADIAEAIEAEMGLAGLLPRVGPVKTWGFDLDGYRQMLKDNMDRELDYLGEADRQRRFAAAVDVPGLVVPTIIPELCRESVLVQSWEDGVRLADLAGWSAADRRSVGVTLAKTLFKSLFVAGQVHADPHPGNYLFRKDAQGRPCVVLLDYGCTVAVPEPARQALLKLIAGCRAADDTDALACFVAMGFDAEKLLPLAGTLPALCRILFEPFLGDGPSGLQDWALSERTGALLGDLRWWFRSAGPPELLLLLRAFHGLVSQLEALRVGIDWWAVVTDAVGPATLAAARSFAPPPVPGADRSVRGFDGLAQYLKILITEGERQVVSLALPAGQVIHLEDLIPADTLKRIRSDDSINLSHIIRHACDTGLQPQPLFHLTTDTRSYRVWLE